MRFSSLTMLFAIVTLLLVACGGDDGGNSNDNQAANNTTASPGAPTTSGTPGAVEIPTQDVIWEVVSDEPVDLLACPALDCEVVGTAEPGDILDVLNTEGGYHEIALEDDSIAYIEARFTAPRSSTQSTQSTPFMPPGFPGTSGTYTGSAQPPLPLGTPPFAVTTDPDSITPTNALPGPPGLPTAYGTQSPPSGPPITQSTSSGPGSGPTATEDSSSFPPGYASPTSGPTSNPLPPFITATPGSPVPPGN